MLAVERCRRAICIDIFQFTVPPDIAAFFHVNFVSDPTKNDYLFHRRASTERVIDIFLEWHNSAAAICTIGRDQSNRAAIGDAIANTIRAKAAEDH